MNDLAQALMVAIRVHAKQTDRQGEPYLLHVLRVVEAVSPQAKVLAALHDVCEDSDWTLKTLAYAIPLSLRDATELSTLTRRPQDTYEQYIQFIAGFSRSLAREVKIADLRDNLGRIPPMPWFGGEIAQESWVRKWSTLERRYKKALQTLEGASEQ